MWITERRKMASKRNCSFNDTVSIICAFVLAVCVFIYNLLVLNYKKVCVFVLAVCALCGMATMLWSFHSGEIPTPPTEEIIILNEIAKHISILEIFLFCLGFFVFFVLDDIRLFFLVAAIFTGVLYLFFCYAALKGGSFFVGFFYILTLCGGFIVFNFFEIACSNRQEDL